MTSFTSLAQTNKTTAMDYSYFNAPPPPYFMGMPPTNTFAHGVDPDTIRSIVSAPNIRQGGTSI